jgi:hypothetical protein
MGLTPGASDLAIIGKNGKTYWLEVKSAGGKLSKHQEDFALSMVDRGHEFLTAYSLDEAVAYLQAWKGEQ